MAYSHPPCLTLSGNTREPPPIAPYFRCPGTRDISSDMWHVSPEPPIQPRVVHAARRLTQSCFERAPPSTFLDSILIRVVMLDYLLSPRPSKQGVPRPTRGVKNRIARNGTKLISCGPRGARHSSTVASPSVTQSRHVSYPDGYRRYLG